MHPKSSDPSHTVSLPTFGRSFTAAGGHTLHRVLVENGIPLRSDCGGQGRCGRCRVRLRLAVADGADSAWETALACQAPVTGDLTLDLPEASLIDPGAVVDKSISAERGLPCVKPTAGKAPALAVDLGTTALAVYLCDRPEGRVTAVATARNPQAVFGADVISRISAVTTDRTHLDRQQSLVCRAVDRMAASLATGAGLDAGRIEQVVAVGNPTMVHLLLGIDPSPLGRVPFEPAFRGARQRPAGSLGMGFNPQAEVRTLPLISGYLGGDIVAAALAVDLDRGADRTLIIDIGTNGEILLAADGRLYGTSCATGPAFEGAAISCGMPALPGAVDRWTCREALQDIAYSTLPDASGDTVPARGLCGSGVVSAAAALHRSGAVDVGGRIVSPPDGRHGNTGDEGPSRLVLVPAGAAEGGRELALTQKDIRAIQLAKGAIYTGITMLCEAAGIGQPDRVLIAGTFGNHLAVDDLITLGVLPESVSGKVSAVGNAAGDGAVCALFDPEFFSRAEALSQSVIVVNLASQAGFQERFVRALSFPEII